MQATQRRPKQIRIAWWRRWWRAVSVIRLLLWTIWVIYRERRRVIRAHERGNYDVQPNIEVLIEVLVAFRKTAIKLGVLMIKLGQFLSSRADLLPERALAVLTSLQDEVPPEPFDHVAYVIESELGKPIDRLFTTFAPECTAAASLGQVHKAVLLSTGETVAVKIQRPAIDQLVAMDLSSLRFVIWLITRFVDTGQFIDLWGIYREFSRTVYEEIDFMTEAANAQRFYEMFADDPTIYIPRIYEDYVTSRVLIMEWIDGIKINDYDTLDAAGINRLEAARRTVTAYFHQFFDVGFFHADPHPGNIFVKRDSLPEDPVIAFLDFGMVGSVTSNMKRLFSDLFLGVVASDAHAITDALSKLGFIGEGANTATIERALTLILEQYYGLTLAEFRKVDMREMVQQAAALLYGQPFRIPARFAFSGRAVSTLVGVATGLAPDFNFFEVATPYAQNFLGLGKENIGETAQELLTQLLGIGRTMLKLPRAIERLIADIETGQIEIKLANAPAPQRTRGRGRRGGTLAGSASGSGLALPLMFLGSLTGAIYLMNQHLSIPGWFCLGLATLLAGGTLLRR